MHNVIWIVMAPSYMLLLPCFIKAFPNFYLYEINTLLQYNNGLAVYTTLIEPFNPWS